MRTMMRATRLTLTTISCLALFAVPGRSLSAQQPTPPQIPAVPPGTQPQPGAPTSPPAAPPLAVPTNIPKRLMAVQQLAWAAYPELRTRGLQMRVEETASGETVTFGFADQDRPTILAVSRPREAQLVIEAAFDAQDAVHSALLRGMLAHTKERRQMKTVTTGLADALSADGAAFGPANGVALLQHIDLKSLQPLLGTLTINAPVFTHDATDDGLFWQVPTTSAIGEQLTLGFEPYLGRLVRLTRGGGQ